VIDRVPELFDMKFGEVVQPGKQHPLSKGQSVGMLLGRQRTRDVHHCSEKEAV